MVRWAALVLFAGCGRVGFDGIPGDGQTVDAGGCSTVGADTIGLWQFESGYGDATGEHDGILNITGGLVAGPCGLALQLDPGNYMKIPDSPELDLPTGSIGLRARIASPVYAFSQAMVGRDAVGTVFNGHFTMGIAASGQAWARLQYGGAEAYRCSAGPIPAATWVHFGVSFGGDASQGFALWVDHVRATGTTFTDPNGGHDCTAPHPFGIDGNDNVLVFGATNWEDGDADPSPPADLYLTDGSHLDEIHLRSTWRDFSLGV